MLHSGDDGVCYVVETMGHCVLEMRGCCVVKTMGVCVLVLLDTTCVNDKAHMARKI